MLLIITPKGSPFRKVGLVIPGIRICSLVRLQVANYSPKKHTFEAWKKPEHDDSKYNEGKPTCSSPEERMRYPVLFTIGVRVKTYIPSDVLSIWPTTRPVLRATIVHVRMSAQVGADEVAHHRGTIIL